MSAIVFDVETTGLPQGWNIPTRHTHKWPYIVQISWMVFDLGENKIVTVNDHIIRLPAGLDVPPDSSDIHGITTKKMREEGQDIRAILVAFREDMRKAKYIVAHNLKFDKSMVEVEFLRHGFSEGIGRQRKVEFCTMLYGEKLCGLTMVTRTGKVVSKYPRLSELHEHLFGTTPSGLHNSLVDILVCFRCFYSLLYGEDVTRTNPAFATMFKPFINSSI